MGSDENMAIKDENTSCSRIGVAVVASELSPRFGIEAATLSLVDVLARCYSVRVITIADAEPEDFVDTQATLESWGRKVAGWKRVVTVLRAFRHRNDLRDNVIILSGVWAAVPMLCVLPKQFRMRTIVWEHAFSSAQVRSLKKLRILRALARPLYARAFAIVSVSESLRSDMRSAGFDGAIEVIPNITRTFESGDTARVVARRLLTIGSLDKRKNQALALRALALLPTDYSLDVLGNGPERTALENLATELGIADRVNFYGFVSNPAEYYARAQCVIHPSLTETYGLVFFEAAGFRKPVVALNRGVMRETIPQFVSGLLAEADPGDFAAAILSLETNPVSDKEFTDAERRRDARAQKIVHDWQLLINSAAS
ncbi:glycosyltransferase involved in cell wall biosynthesis [Mycobacterium sp. OAS707]|uniref:glycosyltransferase n=1 Tax=Mycobacterium sp. OAS707 TaxID=2663822 RepID=UPI001788FD5D|nr:glycosyltransferase [Mycobacterium sp. OAS707]MBE1547964.1 glycosyltransferase involved in cell wall biosynthesis [Mycobacterium sp. OAS707]